MISHRKLKVIDDPSKNTTLTTLIQKPFAAGYSIEDSSSESSRINSRSSYARPIVDKFKGMNKLNQK